MGIDDLDSTDDMQRDLRAKEEGYFAKVALLRLGGNPFDGYQSFSCRHIQGRTTEGSASPSVVARPSREEVSQARMSLLCLGWGLPASEKPRQPSRSIAQIQQAKQ